MRLMFSRRMFWQHVIALSTIIIAAVILIWGRAAPSRIIASHITPTVKPGETITVTRHIQWLRSDCRWLYVTGDLIDSMGFHHTFAKKFLGRPVGVAYYQREWPVPFTMPWGKSTFRSTVSFGCFPFYGLWPIELWQPELYFHVIPPTKDVSGGG